MSNPNLKGLENRIVEWAMTRPSIRAAIICGSTERRVNPGDEWADLDFEIYVTDFSEFLTSTEWLNNFGRVWTYLHLRENDGPVFLALYGGEKVDFHFFSIEELQRLVNAQELHDSYFKGYRTVVDKDRIAAQLPAAPSAPPLVSRPSEDEFAVEVNAFWYGALYVAKQIRRRNLWVVKFRDWTTKQNLLRMLEWHAQATHHWQCDTWHDGHFMSQWTDTQTWEALFGAFGAYGPRSSWQALFATSDLFHRVAIETAHHLGYAYSFDLDNQVTGYIKSLYQADSKLE
jgi:aminoglycoside 6-adenylyltransferase